MTREPASSAAYENRWHRAHDAAFGHRVHLTSWAEVDVHRRHEGKWDGYRRLLLDFGMDPEQILPPAPDRSTPRLLYAEQPGCWLYPEDLVRSQLLDRLIARGVFAADSERLALAHDAYRHWGPKHIFVLLAPDQDLGETTFLSASFHRRHRHASYGGLRLDAPQTERIGSIFEVLDALLEAAARSPDVFVEQVRRQQGRGLPVACRRLLPGNASNADLAALGERLARLDLGAARRPLGVGRQACIEGASWCRLWQRVNGAFFDAPVGDLSPLFNRYLLAVDDPLRMAERLADLPGQVHDGWLSAASMVDDEGRFWNVGWEVETGTLVRTLGKRRRATSWQELREFAQAGRTGGPTALVEYLALAANNVYLVGDPYDGESPFEKLASQLCHEATWCKFPRVAMPEPFIDEPTYYLDAFTPEFRAATETRLERFFDTRCDEASDSGAFPLASGW